MIGKCSEKKNWLNFDRAMKPPPPYPGSLGPPNPSFGPLVDCAYSIMLELSRPLSGRDIRRVISERQLFDVDQLQHLEAAMDREIQLGGTRFKLLDTAPGLYCLITNKPAHAQLVVNHRQLEKEKRKYKQLKQFVKRMVFLNACYCDEVRDLQEKLNRATEERRFLLRRAMQHELLLRASPKSAHTGSSAGRAHSGHASSSTHNTPHANMLRRLAASAQGQGTATTKDQKKKKTINKLSKEILAKSKNSKRRPPPLINKRLVQPIPLDNQGRPLFPIVLGSLTVHSLGEIVTERQSFHSAEHIYPAGYCSTRIYASMKNPEKRCLYTCKIVEAEDGGPRFEISPEDRPEFVITGHTATECHRRLLSIINSVSGADVLNVNKNRGPEFFGFSHPTVHNLIQSSVGARKCQGYKWVKFDTLKGDEQIPLFMEHAVALNFDALQRYPPFKGAMGKRAQQQQQQQQQQQGSCVGGKREHSHHSAAPTTSGKKDQLASSSGSGVKRENVPTNASRRETPTSHVTGVRREQPQTTLASNANLRSLLTNTQS